MSKKIIDVWVGTPRLGKYWHSDAEYIEIVNKVSVYATRAHLDTLIKDLQQMKEDYAHSYSDLHFDTVHDCGCPSRCDCTPSCYLKGKRHETDVEYNLRIKEETARQAAREQRERDEFEKLKAKYGND